MTQLILENGVNIETTISILDVVLASSQVRMTQ
jgi:hypothetical protein